MFIETNYDAILLGAGHNALVLQAYLGKAGLKTLCIERRDIAGGGLATMEDPRHPGFLHNTHSFYHRAITEMPWYRDLDLARHGSQYLQPDLNVALLLKNGDALEWWTDFEKTAASFARFSRKDAESLRRWRDRFVPVLDKILVHEASAPPVPAARRAELLARCPEGRLLLDVSRLSPRDFVLREFEHPVIQGGLLFFNGLREVDLRCAGFGHHIPALLASRKKAQMSVGGSAGLARALVNAVKTSGGEILYQTEPQEILVEGGKATGVRTRDGSVFKARHFVASDLNPHQTFLDLLRVENVPRDWREKALNFRYNLIAPLFALNLNLHEPPQYKAAAAHPHLKDAFMVIMGLEGYGLYPQMVECHERGAIPPPIMWGTCPTQFDPTQVPPGKHTAFMWEKLPYALNGDARNWDRERDRHGKELLDFWSTFAPNLRDAVISSFTRSALDTERTFPNMRHGDLLIGAFTHGQIGHDRPFAGAGHYRAHVKGLYLCGSCCHPGGNITGLPGYNCAQVVLADLGLPTPWAPPSMEERLKALG